MNNIEINEKLFNEYMQFINKHKINNKVDFYCEKHHILPRKLYPNLEKDKNNIVKLRARDHLKAHIMLYKVYNKRPEMAYALNMMANRGKLDKRFNIDDIEKDFEYYGLLYEKFREEVAKIISKSNSGHIMSDKQKEILVRYNKGKVVVRDKNGNTMRVDKNDPRYLNGELVHNCFGCKHSEETKQLMSDNSHKGLHSYYNEEGKIVYAKDCPNGYKKGLPNNLRKNLSNIFKDMIYLYNPQTDESIRQNKNLSIPKGFIKQRKKTGGFQGFDKVNESIRCFNIETKELRFIKRCNIDWDKDIVSISASDGKNILNNNVYIIENIIYTTSKDLVKYLDNTYNIHLPKYITDSSRKFSEYIQNDIDINEIKRMKYTSRGKNQLILNNSDKNLKDLLKINLVKLKDLVYNKDYKIFVSDKKRAKYVK